MTDESATGERIAKVMARAGIASRRDAEKMILAGRVAVNGTVVSSPALDVLPSDKVTLDGKPIDAPQPARLWLYYKPTGLVTSAKDEKGRQTVFDTMPEGMPRVMSVGRLDLSSEGLLLLTNDGELKRRLELPSTGWLRKYRVRVNGRPNEATFDPLRRGVTIEGEDFQPMEVTLDKQQGANAWLTVGIREGRNREVRRAMAEVGLVVNRLIRVSYGPFRLNTMKPGDVVEVKQRVLREQLGSGDAEEKPARRRPAAAGKGPRRDGATGRKPREGGTAFGKDRAPKPRPLGEERHEERTGRRAPGPGAGDRDARKGGAPRPRSPIDGETGERPRRPRPPRDEGTGPERRGPERGGRPYKSGGETGSRPPRKPGGKPFGSRAGREDEGETRGPRKAGDRPFRSESPRERDAEVRAPRKGGPKPARADRPSGGPKGERSTGPRGPARGERPGGSASPGHGKAPSERRPEAPRGPRAGDGRPGPKPGGKPGPRPGGKPGGKPGPRPGGRPDSKPGGRSGPKPGGKPRGKG